MECVFCKETAVSLSNTTGKPYCSEACFDLDTSPAPRAPIGDCAPDDTDPFTFDAFGDMEERDVIELDGHCFHLPSVYNWAINKENPTNPLTRERFSADAMRLLRVSAFRRYPLTIKVVFKKEIEAIINTTSLISVEGGVRLTAQRLLGKVVDGLFRYIQDVRKANIRLIFGLPSGPLSDMKLLAKHKTDQFYSLTRASAMVVYKIEISDKGLPDRFTTLQSFVATHGFPILIPEFNELSVEERERQDAELTRRLDALRRSSIL